MLFEIIILKYRYIRKNGREMPQSNVLDNEKPDFHVNLTNKIDTKDFGFSSKKRILLSLCPLFSQCDSLVDVTLSC